MQNHRTKEITRAKLAYSKQVTNAKNFFMYSGTKMSFEQIGNWKQQKAHARIMYNSLVLICYCHR